MTHLMRENLKSMKGRQVNYGNTQHYAYIAILSTIPIDNLICLFLFVLFDVTHTWIMALRTKRGFS